MGASSGGNNAFRLNPKMFRNKKRASLSFFIVVLFFCVFGIIIFTEIFLIDERGRGGGVVVRHGFLGSKTMSVRRFGDRSDYDDLLQNGDYAGLGGGFDENVQALLRDSLAKSGIKQPVFPFKINMNNERFVVNIKSGESQKPVLGQIDVQKLEAQLPPYPKEFPPRNGVWQNVTGTRFKFFVFSAYYERRKNHSVRLIGATKTRDAERVFCRLWYKVSDNDNFVSSTVLGKIKTIRENWNLKYSAVYVLCPIPKNMSAPHSVSIVHDLKIPIANNIFVLSTDNDPTVIDFTKVPNRLAVCVKPFHFDYNNIYQILEFIELHRIMGVEHFVFYNHTIGNEVDCILKDYVSAGVVTMLPWELDLRSQKDIRTEGIFAALNDCLYRTMYRYSYVLFVDVDEYIIPRDNDTLPDLISFLNNHSNTRNIGSYSIQNAFFYLQWPDDEVVHAVPNPLTACLFTQRKTRRCTKINPHKQRSKYFCRPELVVEVGNHFIWEFMPGYNTLHVPKNIAIMHHYRVCEAGGEECIKEPSTIDKTTFRYQVRLVNSVEERLKDLRLKCAWSENILPSSPNSVREKLENGYQISNDLVRIKR